MRRTNWCVADCLPEHDTQMIILSEHSTIKHARGALPIHRKGGARNPHIVKRTTTWEVIP